MKFEELTDYQKNFVSNGCGAKGSITPPRAEFFKAACDQHDLDYFLGYREKDRLKADLRLRSNMRKLIKKVSCRELRTIMNPVMADFLPNFCVKPFFYRWADIYFIGVACFGWQYFYYGNERQVLP